MEFMKGNFIIKKSCGVIVILKHKYLLVIAVFTGIILFFQNPFIAVASMLLLGIPGLFGETRIEINTENDTVIKGWFLFNRLVWSPFAISHYSICSFEIEEAEDSSSINLVSDERKYILTSLPSRDEAEALLKEILKTIRS